MAAFARVWAELKQTWVIWVILNFSGGMKALVNHTEQPFARSLVACDAPLQPGNYTGSKWCGDRLHVIGNGYTISQRGQAQENFAMMCSLTFVAVAINSFGRRFAILLGLTGTLCSVILFVIASMSPDLGRMLFAVGQCLQGLYPVEYIFGMVVLDLSTRTGGDAMATYDIKFYEAVVGTIIFQGLGVTVQVIELVDYTELWSKILMLTVSIILLAFFALPETMPPDSRKAVDGEDSGAKLNSARKLWDEVQNYAALRNDFRCRRYLSLKFLENIVGTFAFGGLSASLMAYHSWTQPGLLGFMASTIPLVMLCMPLIDVLVNRFGFHDTYMFCIVYLDTLTILVLLLLPISDTYAVACFMMMMPAFGFNSIRGVVDSRFCQKEDIQRFSTLQWIMGMWQGTFVGPTFALLFNASGVTYWERCGPSLLGVAALLGMAYVTIYVIYDMDGKEGFGITLKQMDEIRRKQQLLCSVLHEGQPTATGAADAQPFINEEVWKGAGLGTAFKKEFSELEGPMKGDAELARFVEGLNTGPRESLELISFLDSAIESATAWAKAAEPADGKKQD